ncbi:fungal-specific transcription factor domain-containing protein [Ilyonectria sp. MPI-CAGE-AT-0026]|nr:fungal-specific transcription factor domain-containing protein [Ilyonectria sp. MPI-CAGE-AT-0026]
MQDARESPERQSGYRRKRVAKACHTCRSMKSKCDGKRPECSRCKGYGYSCTYSVGQPRRGYVAVQGQSELRKALEEYDGLVDHLISKLQSPEERKSASSTASRIKSQANAALAGIGASLLRPQPPTCSPKPETTSPGSQIYRSERYLGEVSDVRFFNLVKRVLQTQDGSPGSEQEVDSYEQDDDLESANAAACRAVKLPSPETFNNFADIYFSTIHLAYPFIPQSMFMASYNEAQSPSGNQASLDTTQLALLYAICAIGAYYNSFLDNQTETNKLHEVYFLRALSLAPPPGIDLSINHVSLLLAQCFYLLAVCRTDSCWTTLGQAVRTAQSIGLHVEHKDSEKYTASGSVGVERRRRVWYSIYVLDRLLSLQLGRPPAIHDGDCYVPLPSRLSDGDIDWDDGEIPVAPEGPSSGDYFLAVISFSHIVGYVLRDLYSPKTGHGTSADMFNTKDLDRQLIQWKLQLPRPLRFDLGHAFDKSLAFRRQRNMLAVKYHHLRALTHRPYLCYPLLRDMDMTDATLAQSNWPLVRSYEKICITEAREMARLLHGISSEKDLVHEFPWWQMISCLICAGSILLVSSIFIQQTEDGIDEFNAESLSDDAETCLRVFEALGTNSTGARIARDMMEKLKECGLIWKNAAGPSETPIPSLGGRQCSLADFSMPTPSNWPAEIIDSMAWSAQFFEAIQPEE